MELRSETDMYQGEFIAYANDILYLMTSSDLKKIYKDDIIDFRIILARNKSKTYGVLTGIVIIPSTLGAIIYSEYRAEFIILAMYIGLPSALATAFEMIRKPHIITYPEDFSDISLLTKYARFPSGFPENLNPDSLEKFNLVNE
jgi:hypothetical protein